MIVFILFDEGFLFKSLMHYDQNTDTSFYSGLDHYKKLGSGRILIRHTDFQILREKRKKTMKIQVMKKRDLDILGTVCVSASSSILI